MATNGQSEVRVLRIDEVVALVGLSRSTIYHLIAAGDFPKPLKLTANAVGWRSDEIEAWINSRVRAC